VQILKFLINELKWETVTKVSDARRDRLGSAIAARDILLKGKDRPYHKKNPLEKSRQRDVFKLANLSNRNSDIRQKWEKSNPGQKSFKTAKTDLLRKSIKKRDDLS